MQNRTYGYVHPQSTSVTQLRGQYVTGFSVGILYLDDCWYPTVPGNVANLSTYPFPVMLKKVPNCTTMKLLNGDEGLLETIVNTAKELEKEGARAITSACGFFGRFQKEVAAAVDIPVYLSSLMQVPWLLAGLKPNKKVGILTAYEKGISPELLENCGIHDPSSIRIQDLSDLTEFSCIIEDRGTFDHAALEQEAVTAAESLVDDDVAVILLECSDLPPYAHAIQQATSRPVYDFITLIHWMHYATTQKPYYGFM